jgi:hypothetical protein
MNTTNPFTTTVPKLESVTDKYRFIPTSEFIADLKGFGYQLESTKGPRQGYGMHSMVFSHASMPKLDGLDLRLLVTNSHDGSSAFRLHLQVGVRVCANLLVSFVPELAVASRIVHRGYAIGKVANAVETVRNHVTRVISDVEILQKTQVDEARLATFTLQATQLRDAKPFRWVDLARTLHYEQRENTAWNVFNRVQESLVKGGYATMQVTPQGAIVRGNRAREVTAVKERVQLNYKLWELATKTLL